MWFHLLTSQKNKIMLLSGNSQEGILIKNRGVPPNNGDFACILVLIGAHLLIIAIASVLYWGFM
jgi:hypothetical protein